MPTKPVLAFPDNVDPFILDIDASDVVIVSVTEWNSTSNYLCVAPPDSNTTIVVYHSKGTAGYSHVYTPLQTLSTWIESTLRTDHGSLMVILL